MRGAVVTMSRTPLVQFGLTTHGVFKRGTLEDCVLSKAHEFALNSWVLMFGEKVDKVTVGLDRVLYGGERHLRVGTVSKLTSEWGVFSMDRRQAQDAYIVFFPVALEATACFRSRRDWNAVISDLRAAAEREPYLVKGNTWMADLLAEMVGVWMGPAPDACVLVRLPCPTVTAS